MHFNKNRFSLDKTLLSDLTVLCHSQTFLQDVLIKEVQLLKFNNSPVVLEKTLLSSGTTSELLLLKTNTNRMQKHF